MGSRFQLSEQDALHIRKWIEASGLENVARIIDELALSCGETRAPAADTLLLQWIAQDVREQPNKPLNAIVSEVVKEFGRDRQPLIAPESLAALLKLKFDQDRVGWIKLAEQTPRPTPQQVWDYYARWKSKTERRVLARLISALTGRRADE